MCSYCLPNPRSFCKIHFPSVVQYFLVAWPMMRVQCGFVFNIAWNLRLSCKKKKFLVLMHDLSCISHLNIMALSTIFHQQPNSCLLDQCFSDYGSWPHLGPQSIILGLRNKLARQFIYKGFWKIYKKSKVGLQSNCFYYILGAIPHFMLSVVY